MHICILLWYVLRWVFCSELFYFEPCIDHNVHWPGLNARSETNFIENNIKFWVMQVRMYLNHVFQDQNNSLWVLQDTQHTYAPIHPSHPDTPLTPHPPSSNCFTIALIGAAPTPVLGTGVLLPISASAGVPRVDIYIYIYSHTHTQPVLVLHSLHNVYSVNENKYNISLYIYLIIYYAGKNNDLILH